MGAPAQRMWHEVIASATAIRHDLHRAPELAWAEHATARTVRDQLTSLGIAWRECAGTGTVAHLATGATGRHVALRGDLDAMPITEESGVAWTSARDGAMHACGHDGHTATLLATATWLAAHEDVLPGPVTLLFQPAEEGGHGAREMIADGALAGAHPGPGRPVDVVFGWHNWPAVGPGRIACPDGAVMSANGTFEVELTGVGGHASQPEATRDPVLAAAATTLALQQIVARRLPPQTAAVVAVTWLDAPSAATVTPSTARLGGSIRVPDTALRDTVFDHIREISEATAQSYGVTASVTLTPRYAATVNHPEPAAELRAALAPALVDEGLATEPGPGATDLTLPVLASEDFSYYLAEVPGAFALVGAEGGHSCHSPFYDFDDTLIAPLVRTYARLAGAPAPPAGG